MGFPKFLMSSTVLAGVVFCAATVPLATFNSKTVTVQVNEEPILMGQVQELAPPYLGIATLFSLGAGIVSLSTLGWRQSSQRLESVTEKATVLEQKIQEQSYLIESLKFSDRRLAAAGLDQFLGDEAVAQANIGASVGVDVEVQAIAEPPTAHAIGTSHTVGTTEAVAVSAATISQKSVRSTPHLIDSDFDRVPPLPQGKTAFGADVSNVFRQPFIHGAEHNVTLNTPSPRKAAEQGDVRSAPVVNNSQVANAEEAQLQELMDKMQKMMEQVEQLQVSQSITQSVA
ncbi:MAG: hypothetical protein F6K09_31825 [Merismopedia sp. SIO2A8]|nr:hypothetical protein [Symploca sp. SIO2B6]NET53092.1 hypothetical protein [Merismopedia sp. SIO2A8]